MAIEFNGSTSGQSIKFPNVIPASMRVWTFMFRLNTAAWVNGIQAWNLYANIVAQGIGMDYQTTGTRFRFYYNYWNTTGGHWGITAPATDSLKHYAVTYDSNSTSNNPLIYVDGVSQTVTETQTPSGAYFTPPASYNFLLGNYYEVTGIPFNGFENDFLIYNRILSATEIAEAYNSRLAIPNRNGLVFAPHLSGAAGLTTFDGSTLAAGNTIADQVSGALGVPAGSPVGRADTYLTYQG
jgi:hypothetical protein